MKQQTIEIIKTLDQIQQEVAKEHNCKDWTVLRNSLYGNRIKFDGIWMRVSHLYALEVAKETQRRCAENARTKLGHRKVTNYMRVPTEVIDKSSILDPKNLAI